MRNIRLNNVSTGTLFFTIANQYFSSFEPKKIGVDNEKPFLARR